MPSISFYDSSSIGVLFSSLGGNSRTNSVSSDLLGINYNDYATIRNGSYTKLLRAYYSDKAPDEVKSAVTERNKNTTSTSKDSSSVLTGVESAADEAKEAADKLLVKDSKSVFEKTTKTGEDGKKTQEYDTDKIYKAVSEFVDGYNSMMTAASKSNTKNISRVEQRLESLTKANEKWLKAVGISADASGKLEIDEDAFKKADMSKVKSLFNNSGGYGYQVSAQASMMHYYAENEASKSNTYANSGMYTYNYSSGTLYNTGI